MTSEEQEAAEVADNRRKRREQQLDYLATQMAVAMNMAKTAEEQIAGAKDALKYLSDESMGYAKRKLNKRRKG